MESTQTSSSNQNKKYKSASTQPQTTASLSNIEQQELDMKILYLRLQYHSKINSTQSAQNYDGQRYKNNFSQQSSLRNNKQAQTKKTYDGYKIESFLESTKSSLYINQSKSSFYRQNISEQQTLNSSYSLMKVHQKRHQQLQNIINDFNYNFIKYVFRHYYEVYINLMVIIIQQFDQVREFQPLLPDQVEVWEIGFIKNIYLMYPPPYHNKDFAYIPEKLKFKLFDIKHNNIYKQPKSKNLIFLKISIIHLIHFFAKFLPQIYSSSFQTDFDLYKSQQILPLFDKKNNKKLKQNTFNFELTNTNYQTQYLLTQMSKIVHKQILKKKPQEITRTKIKKICEQKLTKFTEWVTFFNFTICVFEHFQKKVVPFRNYVQLKRNEVVSYTDLKIRFFMKTIQNPALLKRIFSESIAQDQHSHLILKLLQKLQYNIENFYNQLHKIKQEQDAIFILSRYQIHFLQYCMQIVSQMCQNNNMSLQTSYNSVRFIIMFFICFFIKKTLARIQRQIYHCHGPFVAQKVKRQNQKEKRHSQYLFRLEKNIKTSFDKIISYADDTQTDKKSTNIEKMRSLIKNDPNKNTQNPTMIDFIKILYASHQKKEILQPSDDLELILTIYTYIIKLLATQCLSPKNFERCFNKLSQKHLNSKPISLEDFLKNQPISQSKTSFKTFSQFKQGMEGLQKQFKIVIIEMLKLYLMTTTFWCYSYSAEEQHQKYKPQKSQDEQQQKDKTTNYKDILVKLDNFYINEGFKINTSTLKDKPLPKINEILQKLTKNATYINYFFAKLYEKGDPKDREIKGILMPNYESQKQIVIPVHIGDIREQEQQQELSPQKNKTQASFQKQQNSTLYLSLSNATKIGNFSENMKKQTQIINLNQIMERKIHKNKLSVFGMEYSRKIGAMIHKEFSSGKSMMGNSLIERNLHLTYSFTDKEGKVYGSQSL